MPQSHNLHTGNIFSKSPLSSFPIISTCSQEPSPWKYFTFYHEIFSCVIMKYFKFYNFDLLTSRRRTPPPHLCGWRRTRRQPQAPRSGRAGWGPAPSCEPWRRCYHWGDKTSEKKMWNLIFKTFTSLSKVQHPCRIATYMARPENELWLFVFN